MSGPQDEVPDLLQTRFCAALDEMTKAVIDTRNSVKKLLEKYVHPFRL